MPLSIQDFKTQNPDYANIPDQELADRLHTKFYSTMPKEDFYKQVGINTQQPPKDEGVIANIGRDEGNELNSAYKEATAPDPAVENASMVRKGVAKVGQVAGALGSAAMSPFKSTLKETVAQPLADTVSNAALNASIEDNPNLSKNITPKDKRNMLGQLHDTSADVIAGSLASSASAVIGTDTQIGGFKSIKDIRASIQNKASAMGKGLPSPVKEFASNTSSDPQAVPQEKPVSDFNVVAEANKGTGLFSRANDPSVTGLNANQQISKNFDAANTQAEKLYTASKMVGEGKTTDATNIAEPLKQTINDLQESAVTPQQSSTLRRLKAIQEKYFSEDTVENTGASGFSVAGETVKPKAQSIELNDLVEIKQALNEGFKSNDFTKSSEIPLVKLNQAIKAKIDSLNTSHPDFVQANKVADQYYGKEVAAKFKDNSELEPFWQPEDHYAYQQSLDQVKYPGAKGYTDATLTRAGKFLDNLNSSNEGRVTAVINALPHDEAVAVLHDAILRAKAVTPSFRNVALNVLGRSGTHGTVGTPIYSAEQAVRNLIGAVIPSQGKEAPLLDLANRVSPKSNVPYKGIGIGGLGYLGSKSFNFGSKQKQQDKGLQNGKQSYNSPTAATNAALASANTSKKNDTGFSLSDLNPISDADAATIKVPENSPITPNVKTFMGGNGGKALQQSIKEHGANANEIMTLVNSESSVKQGGKNNYGQMTDIAWKQAQKLTGRTLNRDNPKDYADAVVSTYQWTANEVKKITGSQGTPSIKDVYPAYNAGISGFKALHDAPPNSLAKDVVPKDVSENNKYFYYDPKTGRPLTTKQTLYAYKNFVEKKMNEYSPANSAKGATKLALNKASSTNEPDGIP